MNSEEYLEKLLGEYSHTFDITKNYELNNRKYPAYAKFYAHNEKYVLTQDVKLWEANSFEHIIFSVENKLTKEVLKQYTKLLEEVLEPLYVRKNQKYPEKNHMYTYISAVIVSNQSIDKDIIKFIKKYRFEKSYLMSIRGWVNARLMCVDLENNSYISNRAGADLGKLHKKILIN